MGDANKRDRQVYGYAGYARYPGCAARDGQRVGVGDRAPDFALPNGSGETVRLSDFAGQRSVVLFFYPKDETAGCVAEVCAFRDSYEVFQETGAEVIGVSSDSEESHQRFAAHHRLPFTLLSDRGGALRKRYGVPATMGVIPGARDVRY